MNSSLLRIWICASGIISAIIGMLVVLFVIVQMSNHFSGHRIGGLIFAVVVVASGFLGFSGAKTLNWKSLGLFVAGSLISASVFFYFSAAAFSSSKYFNRRIAEMDLIAGISIIVGLFHVHNTVLGAIHLVDLKRNPHMQQTRSFEMNRTGGNTEDLGKYLKFAK